MGDFLLLSLVASLVLTVVLNLGLRFWPGRSGSSRPGPLSRPEINDGHIESKPDADQRPSVQVYFPWKAMLAVSVLLTVVLNVVALLAR